MPENVQLYYFSPTGGTKACGEMFCKAVAQNTHMVDLGTRGPAAAPEGDWVVFALPVFAGRIPTLTAEKISALNGAGKKAVTLVVYGTRAYDDALLELNDIATAAGFCVVASGAVIARHSMVPAVGLNRPDQDDLHSITDFAHQALKKLESGESAPVSVPGNRPYREGMNSSASPICLPACIRCGTCVSVCPTAAIQMDEKGVKTNAEPCMLCMACTAACPENARVLPPAMQESMNQKLSVFIPVRRENEYFL